MYTQLILANIILILLNILISYKGFKDAYFFDKYKFEVYPILKKNEYYRVLSSSFLHANWPHLLFNMFSLYSFGESVESIFGPAVFMLIYFASMIGGDLLSLMIHKNHYDYSAIGASGAVSGIVFSSIFLLPGGSVMIFMIPIPIPASVYAFLFVVVSIFGIKSQSDNIGHEAHLGGAITGMLLAAIIAPDIVQVNLYLFLAILASVIGFLVVYLKLPFFSVNLNKLKFNNKSKWRVVANNPFNQEELTKKQSRKQLEMNRILDKINQVGLEGLTEKERNFFNGK